MENDNVKTRTLNCSNSSCMYNMNLLERIHSAEKPHSCRYCDESYNTKYNLKEHEMIHTAEKI